MSRQTEIARIVHVRWGWPQKTAWLASEWLVALFHHSDVVPVDGQICDDLKRRLLRERPDVLTSMLAELAASQVTFAQQMFAWVPRTHHKEKMPADALALLVLLDSAGALTVGEIKDRFAPTPHTTVVGAIDRAQELRLVERTKQKHDARTVLVSLTAIRRRELQNSRTKNTGA